MSTIVDIKAPLSKVALHNVELPVANANILSTAISPDQPVSYFNISVCAAVEGILSITRTIGVVTTTEKLNSGVSLVGGALYLFSIPMRRGDSINFRYSSTGGKLLLLRVEEVTA